MIEAIFEWIFTSLIYGTFSAIRAGRRRRRYMRGGEVTFPGLVLGGLDVKPTAVGYLRARLGSLESIGSSSVKGPAVDVPLPVPGTPVEVTDIAAERLDWRKHPTASYSSELGRVDLACRSVDMKLLQVILQGPALTVEEKSGDTPRATG